MSLAQNNIGVFCKLMSAQHDIFRFGPALSRVLRDQRRQRGHRGTSLITVPVLLAFGVEPRTALATNMLALACLSGGAAMRFAGKGEFEQRGLPLLLILTLFGSVAGALLVFAVPETLIPIFIAAAMLAVAIVMLRPTPPAEAAPGRESGQRLAGYVATLLLAICFEDKRPQGSCKMKERPGFLPFHAIHLPCGNFASEPLKNSSGVLQDEIRNEIARPSSLPLPDFSRLNPAKSCKVRAQPG